MLREKMEKALNEQLNAEMYSAYLYLSMSAHFKGVNLNGFANWMMVQAQEEMEHAMKFYNFIQERGGTITLKSIDGPPTSWDTPLTVFEAVLEHEQKVTGLINDLVDLSIAEKDHASNIFLQWFVTEQVEEEDNADDAIKQIKMVENDKSGLFMLDRELGQRTYTPDTEESEE